MALSTLLKVVEETEPGPSPRFTPAHTLLAFMTIGSAGTIGRQALARSSALGEGSIRTVLRKLTQKGYVESNTLGCFLTPRGTRTFASILERLSPPLSMVESSLTVGSSQAAVLVRSPTSRVGSGIEQRDSAIRVGALGATTYVFKSNSFSVPGGSENCERDFPSDAWAVLRNELEPKNGDAVVVCGAREETTAKLGALSAALTLA